MARPGETPTGFLDAEGACWVGGLAWRRLPANQCPAVVNKYWRGLKRRDASGGNSRKDGRGAGALARLRGELKSAPMLFHDPGGNGKA